MSSTVPGVDNGFKSASGSISAAILSPSDGNATVRLSSEEHATPATIDWPTKYDLFGVQVSATNYTEATDVICAAAAQRTPAVVSLHPVHAIIESVRNRELMEQVNRFEIIATDGQPVRWALNMLHGAGLEDRVYGPELMLRLCERAARDGISIFLYGSSTDVLSRLESQLNVKFPALEIAGSYSPPFRPLTAEEDGAVIQLINESGAGLVFIGLGCPKQDKFAAEHQGLIQGVQVCVGAAFDFHAGNKKTAPAWMQRHGLEWLFRLIQEPGRLWKRYLFTNSLFVIKLSAALLQRGLRRRAN
ncbi:MAG: WecB/TagA/CpsF family glycosyltransferase [Planctomycetales bacterium]|nr:WecB/TagA/CpsF family glycosyltransferase [Planctomycetales bacterium]